MFLLSRDVGQWSHFFSLLLKCQSAVEGADLQQAASPAGRRFEGRQTALVFNLSASFGSYLRRASLVKSDMGSQHFASTQKKKREKWWWGRVQSDVYSPFHRGDAANGEKLFAAFNKSLVRIKPRFNLVWRVERRRSSASCESRRKENIQLRV